METPIDKIVRRAWVYFLSLLILFHGVSCTYFKATQVGADFATTINDIGEIHQYFIVHDGDASYSLTEITADSTKLSGTLATTTQPVYYTEERQKRYKKFEKNIVNEVHIYLKEGADSPTLGYAEIPVTDIEELRVIDLDTGKTILSYVFSTLGIIAGAFAVLLIIVALTKSSCPYVYVHDGESFLFTGETFGGAIGENMARDDYMPLPAIRPVDGRYQLRITNELKERQYTDVAELVLVNHPAEQKVLLDKYGEVQVLADPQPPVEVHSYAGESYRSVLAASDNDIFFFNDEDYSENGLIATFKKPADAVTGKLLLSGKNTLWFDYLFGEFLQKFGSAHDAFMERQSKLSGSERMQKMLDNNIPLSIYAKRNGTWELVDYLLTVGPLASREFVVPIDLSRYPGETIEIKIETGFMFWELDRLAMDFTENTEVNTFHLSPLTAFGTGQQDWTAALAAPDGVYMAQETTGDVAELTFAVPPVPEGQVQSAFLHTRGYYELIRDFTGPPKLAELNKFKKPSYFSTYSRARYLQFLDKEGAVEDLAQVTD